MLHTIRCTGKYGKIRRYVVRIVPDEIKTGSWWAEVAESAGTVPVAIFEFREMDDRTLRLQCQQVSQFHRQEGIPDVIILLVPRTLQKEVVVSSTNSDDREENELRNGAADKVWQRLVENGHAHYDEEADRYRVKLER